MVVTELTFVVKSPTFQIPRRAGQIRKDGAGVAVVGMGTGCDRNACATQIDAGPRSVAGLGVVIAELTFCISAPAFHIAADEQRTPVEVAN